MLVLLYILVAVYLTVGLVYGLYILLNGIDPWYVLPINILGGPLALIRNYFKFVVKKKRIR